MKKVEKTISKNGIPIISNKPEGALLKINPLLSLILTMGQAKAPRPHISGHRFGKF